MSEDPKDPPSGEERVDTDQQEEDLDRTLSLAEPTEPYNAATLGDEDAAGRATQTVQPESIAGYRIIGKLGQGGMGVVWEAEQERPTRRVALKVLRQDHQVDEYHARMFQREVEILARLKHPNIGAIYESGHTDDGRDYFAMELVRGKTLAEWLDSRPPLVDSDELGLRLRLFLTISDAVHYAHQRGVIHRDIKPSNIVVSDEQSSDSHSATGSGHPMVKILDFGLARLTDVDVQATAVSEIGLIKGTLQYMSPEQARGDMDAIDIRTDVYALGVILYEILTTRRPYDVSPAAVAEAVRVICQDAPKPLRQSWSGARKLDADLETIVGKALEKEADRRYASAAAMADDIERHLASQPIEARPPSALYQLRKFAGRNQALVAFAAAAVLTLIVFAVTMTVQAKRIRQEAQRANREAAAAREVSEFMIGLFDRSDPTLTQGNDLSARDVLDTGAERIEKLRHQPQTQAAFMETMGRVFTVLGDFERAEPLLDRAVDIRTEFAEDDEIALADSLHHQANVLDQTGRYDEAEVAIRRAVEIRERKLGDDPSVASCLNVLGNVLWHQGRLDEAEVVHRKALAIREQALPADDPKIAQSLHNLGALRYFAADYVEAERLYRRSIEIEEAAFGRDNHNLATSLHTLAIVYQDQDRFEEALDLERQSLAIREKVLGPDHPHVALSLTTLGNIYRATGRAEEAETLIRRAIVISDASYGPDHGETWWMRRSLARTLIALEKYAATERELAILTELVKSSDDPTEEAGVLEIYGELYLAQGQYEISEDHYRRAITILAADSPGSPWVGYTMAGLARVYREADRIDEAGTTFNRAIELMGAGWGTDDPDYRRATEELAELESRSR